MSLETCITLRSRLRKLGLAGLAAVALCSLGVAVMSAQQPSLQQAGFNTRLG